MQVARFGLRILSPRAPELAARYAERLFTTARRHPRPAWEEAALATATRKDLTHEGMKIPTWTWGDRDAPAVVLVHGWEGRGSQLAAFVDPLLRRELRVVTFDAPGHGESGSRRASVVEHARALITVAESAGPVHGVVGHSVGGAATLLATRLGLQAERFVLVAPPIGPQRFVAGFTEMLDLDGTVKSDMLARIERHYGLRFEDLDARIDASSLEAPLLVFHDGADVVVPWSDGAAIAGAATNARMVTTKGLGHRRILRAPEVVEKAAAFLGEGRSTFAETLDGELFFRETRRAG